MCKYSQSNELSSFPNATVTGLAAHVQDDMHASLSLKDIRQQFFHQISNYDDNWSNMILHRPQPHLTVP